MMAAHKECCIVSLPHLPKRFVLRRLNSKLTKHVVTILHEACARSPSVIPGGCDMLVCYPCFDNVEKLLRLRKEVEALEDKFARLMQRSAEEWGWGISERIFVADELQYCLSFRWPYLYSCSGYFFTHFFNSESLCVHTHHLTRSFEWLIVQ